MAQRRDQLVRDQTHPLHSSLALQLSTTPPFLCPSPLLLSRPVPLWGAGGRPGAHRSLHPQPSQPPSFFAPSEDSSVAAAMCTSKTPSRCASSSFTSATRRRGRGGAEARGVTGIRRPSRRPFVWRTTHRSFRAHSSALARCCVGGSRLRRRRHGGSSLHEEGGGGDAGCGPLRSLARSPAARRAHTDCERIRDPRILTEHDARLRPGGSESVRVPAKDLCRRRGGAPRPRVSETTCSRGDRRGARTKGCCCRRPREPRTDWHVRSTRR